MTRNCWAWALIAAVSLPWSPAFAGPEEAVDPKATIDTVEVTAQREALRKAIHGFVANVTRFDGENVARWRLPICPAVIGATPQQGEFVRSRILETAVAAGAPIERDQVDFIFFSSTTTGYVARRARSHVASIHGLPVGM